VGMITETLGIVFDCGLRNVDCGVTSPKNISYSEIRIPNSEIL